MRHYILIAFILLGCASQMKPSGGPIDTEGPKVIQIYPENKSITDLFLNLEVTPKSANRFITFESPCKEF